MEIDLAWAAGLFEGEGCFATRQLMLRMTDEDVVRRFATVVGCGQISGPYTPPSAKPHYRPVWVWSVGRRRDAEALIAKMLPLLGARRAAAARAFLARPRYGRPHPAS